MSEANREIVDAIRRSTRLIIGAIVLSALVIIFTVVYLRNQEPYWKCASLSRGGVRDGEIEVYDKLGCGTNPNLLPASED